jgi:integrase
VRRGCQLASGKDDIYRLATTCSFGSPGVEPATTLGDKSLDAITTDDVEVFRDARKAKGLSASAINHDLRLLRKMFNWWIRKGYVSRTPFKVGSEVAIALERELPRNKCLQDADAEQQLLDAANPHLRGVITAMLDTACRPPVATVVRREPLSSRADHSRREGEDPARTDHPHLIPTDGVSGDAPSGSGKDLPPDAYVFGNALGHRVKSVQGAWTNARQAANLGDFQLRDLRHEAASRVDEAGVPIVYVSSLLGHSNLSTTSRYLNIHRRGLHLAMQKLEESRTPNATRDQSDTADSRAKGSVAQTLHTAGERPLAVAQNPPGSISPKTIVQ